MKFKILFLFIFGFLFAYGQTIPTDSLTGKFKYEQVIQADSLKQSDIYTGAKNWIVRTLKSSDNAINLDNLNKSSLNATGNLLLSNQGRFNNITVNFKFSVYCKDGKYKVVVDNFSLNYIYKSIEDGSSQQRMVSLEEGFKNEYLYKKGGKLIENTYVEINDKIKKMIDELESSVLSGKIVGDKEW
ncbi:MAG: DUF4468 domain-containing protein [Bacteroidia bacterium]